MITPEQRRYIEAHAYVPEHLPRYVTAITAAHPYFFGDYVAYAAGERLIFVGYPLSGAYDGTVFLAALDAATARFRPRLIAVAAPALPPALAGHPASPPDTYYRLDLSNVRPDKKLRNLLRRAERELTLYEAARFSSEHARLVAAFLTETPVDEGTRFIFERVGRYAGGKRPGDWKALLRLRSPTGMLRDLPVQTVGADQPFLLEARDAAGRLVAFDIATFSGEYAFYLFNFRSRESYVPGASDLLLARLIALAQAQGKRHLNLGLGINAGVRGFKEKWGAEPFLPHVSCAWERPRAAWEEVLAGV